jgi:hypothetical protein
MGRKRPQRPGPAKTKRNKNAFHHSPLHMVLNVNNLFYSRIKDYGLPVDDVDALECAPHRLSIFVKDPGTLRFAISQSEKAMALIICVDKELDKQIAAHGLQGQLEPLLWDDYATSGLVLYRQMDKSFWAWNFKELRMVGHYWTDLIVPDFVF